MRRGPLFDDLTPRPFAVQSLVAVASIPHEIAFSASLGRGWLANCQDGCGTAWNELPGDQVECHWEHQLCPCLEGLTSEEYLWEPVTDAWSVRPRGAAATSMAAGAGGLGIDWAYPEPSPAPVTTIAWRLGHSILGVLGMPKAAGAAGCASDPVRR